MKISRNTITKRASTKIVLVLLGASIVAMTRSSYPVVSTTDNKVLAATSEKRVIPGGHQPATTTTMSWLQLLQVVLQIPYFRPSYGVWWERNKRWRSKLECWNWKTEMIAHFGSNLTPRYQWRWRPIDGCSHLQHRPKIVIASHSISIIMGAVLPCSNPRAQALILPPTKIWPFSIVTILQRPILTRRNGSCGTGPRPIRPPFDPRTVRVLPVKIHPV